jgi:hypothetical protein
VIAFAVLSAVITGCSSGRTAPTLASQQRQQAQSARHALSVGRSTATAKRLPQVRLGLTAEAADATALAAIHLGYYTQELGGHIQFQPAVYASATAEESALQAGRLDAAYLTPRAAVTAWRATGRRLRIVSGAATNRAGTTPVAVLVMTQAFLTSHHDQATQILQAQVRATQILNTQPALGRTAVSTELAGITGHKIAPRQLAASFDHMAFTCNPLTSAILAGSRLSTGQADLFDLHPLNQILTTSGQVAIR